MEEATEEELMDAMKQADSTGMFNVRTLGCSHSSHQAQECWPYRSCGEGCGGQHCASLEVCAE